MEQDQFRSYWQEQEKLEFERLSGDENAEAVIVGGGLCGLLCAYELLEKGVGSIVVLEARKICGGTTSHTTAKITSQHDLIYHTLLSQAGTEFARGYAKANQDAVERFQQIVEKEKIECDFHRCDAYVYATKAADVNRIEDEAVAAQTLSIDAECVYQCELPLDITAAVRFGGQARFHPLKFAYALARILKERGVRIFEDSPAFSLEDNVLLTGKGRVYGKQILLCTHYPFLNLRGFYFAKIVQDRSYILALKGAPKLEGMYIGCGSDPLSFRYQEDGESGLILLGGASHKTGHEPEKDHYAVLEQQAAGLYPGSEVGYRWSAQDCMTNDSIPYIGNYRQFGRHVFLATGFNKWGMTGSMAAAHILCGLVTEGKSDTGFVFSPERRTLWMQAGKFATELGDTVSNFFQGYTDVPKKSLPELKNGEGGVVNYKGAKLGAYRNGEGVLHCVKPTCTHMGCPLSWNAEESTWDCPCHGSRFDADGKVMESPTVRKLEKRGPN